MEDMDALAKECLVQFLDKMNIRDDSSRFSGILNIESNQVVELLQDNGIDNCFHHFDITTEICAKEQALDFETISNEVIQPMVVALVEKISRKKGEFNSLKLSPIEDGTSVEISQDGISIRIRCYLEPKYLKAMFSIDIAFIEKKQPKIFLGGTCNGSLWRNALIKELKIEYFNPVVEDWTEECQKEEIKQRRECDYCLYVITPLMLGTYSIAEVVQDSLLRSEKTILCITEFDQDPVSVEKKITYSDAEFKSLMMVASMVDSHGAKVCESLQEVADYVNGMEEKVVLTHDEE